MAFVVNSPKRIGCASVHIAASISLCCVAELSILAVKKQMTELRK